MGSPRLLKVLGSLGPQTWDEPSRAWDGSLRPDLGPQSPGGQLRA